MFENRLKSRIQYCERSELRSHFEWIFGIFNELLSTQNVNVARFARNIECDFFGDFQTLWRRETLVPQQFSFRANIVKIDLNYFDLLKLTTL